MIAYLSGAMEKAADEGAGWREEMTVWLKSTLNHDTIDPVVSSQELVKAHDAQDYRRWKTEAPEKFIEFVRKAIDLDLNNVMNEADYIICLWNSDVFKGGGSHGELTMAYYKGKPVYLVNHVGENDLSGWIMACSTIIFRNFDSLRDYLELVYKVSV